MTALIKPACELASLTILLVFIAAVATACGA